jgi:stage II sporulation protein AB (anti-sigma F factor)
MFGPNSAALPARQRLPARLPSASLARAFVRRYARDAGFDAITVQDIEVAVGEAVTNAILHGVGGDASDTTSEITISVQHEAGFFVICIEDHGPGFDMPEVESSTLDDLLAERGRGLALMGMLMDRLDMHRIPGGMVVRMERRLPNAVGIHPTGGSDGQVAASPSAFPVENEGSISDPLTATPIPPESAPLDP